MIQRWFHINFDPTWVTCRACSCREQFFLKDVKRKNKCPKCRIDNYGYRKSDTKTKKKEKVER